MTSIMSNITASITISYIDNPSSFSKTSKWEVNKVFYIQDNVEKKRSEMQTINQR